MSVPTSAGKASEPLHATSISCCAPLMPPLAASMTSSRQRPPLGHGWWRHICACQDKFDWPGGNQLRVRYKADAVLPQRRRRVCWAVRGLARSLPATHKWHGSKRTECVKEGRGEAVLPPCEDATTISSTPAAAQRWNTVLTVQAARGWRNEGARSTPRAGGWLPPFVCPQKYNAAGNAAPTLAHR